MLNSNALEIELANWRHGQTTAERMAANILCHEGYQQVTPQCPLGGPDGGKDIVCYRNGEKAIVACYFPTSQQTFNEIQKKFLYDFQGATANQAKIFIFFTNQRLTPSERQLLCDGKMVDIYCLERLLSILTTPNGGVIQNAFLLNQDSSQLALLQRQRDITTITELLETVDIESIEIDMQDAPHYVDIHFFEQLDYFEHIYLRLSFTLYDLTIKGLLDALLYNWQLIRYKTQYIYDLVGESRLIFPIPGDAFRSGEEEALYKELENNYFPTFYKSLSECFNYLKYSYPEIDIRSLSLSARTMQRQIKEDTRKYFKRS